MHTALIDGDSILYIIAWLYKEETNDDVIREVTDQFIRGIMTATEAVQYIGALGHPVAKSYRYGLAKYKPYKGTRKEKDEFFVRLEPIIRQRLEERWKFLSLEYLEADDIVGLATDICDEMGVSRVICSPDKDLRQIPGQHYDYRKSEFAQMGPQQSDYFFHYLMLVGDESDNVAGLPGMGPKKAEAALMATDLTVSFYEQTVRELYNKYFGNYYGNVIFEENKAVLGLLRKNTNTFNVGLQYSVGWYWQYIKDALQTYQKPEQY